MKDITKISLLIGAALFAYKAFSKSQNTSEKNDFMARHSGINKDENRVKYVSLAYSDLGGGSYHVKYVLDNGDTADYEFTLDNPEEINLWIDQARYDGATITTF